VGVRGRLERPRLRPLMVSVLPRCKGHGSRREKLGSVAHLSSNWMDFKDLRPSSR
jgi:hypothetical protein